MVIIMKYKLNNNLYFVVVFLIMAIGLTKSAFGQTTDELVHRKYWYYKTRLDNDFIKVGLDSGESIPVHSRGVSNATGWNDVNPKMAMSDATSHLGYYIGLLGTEYYLLANSTAGLPSQRNAAID